VQHEKVKWFSQQNRLLVMADDTGLEIESLGGEPGVHEGVVSNLTRNKSPQVERVFYG